MKNKNLKIIITVFAIIIVIIIVVMMLISRKNNNGPKDNNVLEKKDECFFSCEEGDIIAINMYYETDIKYVEVDLNNNIAYGLDYNLGWVSESNTKLKKLRNMSSQATAALVYGYPNCSFEELGLKNDMEARMATQLAVWRIVSAKELNDSLKTKNILDMKNLQSKEEYVEFMERVVKVADEIVSRSVDFPYYANPSLDVTSDESQIRIINKEMIVGPFVIVGYGYEIDEINVLLEQVAESFILCDAQGNEKKEFSNMDEIYVKCSQSVGNVEFKLNVTASGIHYVGEIFGTDDTEDMLQDICCLKKCEDELSVVTPISLPEIQGEIQVIVVDDKEIPIEAIEIQLSNQAGEVLETLKSNKDGIVLFDELDAGNYIIQQIGDNKNYHIIDIPIQVEVEYNNTTKIQLNNSLVNGSIKIVSIDENKENVLSGITYELLDREKNVIQSLISDEDGVVLFENLKKGIYYIREIASPKNVCIDSTERKLVIDNSNLIIECSILHYYARGKVELLLMDQEERPIENVKIEIFDLEHHLVDEIFTDENGYATSKYLLLGKYYYKQTYVPETIVIDENEYEFAILNNWDLVKEIVMCEKK